jgi:hypothetical protein
MNDLERIREIEIELSELDEKQNDIERKRSGSFALVA